jgi:CheY-like chemotaxis protein
VAFEHDGITVLDILNGSNYDALIVQQDLFVKTGKEITFHVRDRERSARKKATRQMAMDARARNQTSLLGPNNTDENGRTNATHPNQVKSLPIVVFTEKVGPKDLKSYMEAGMDGCLSRPFDKDALVTTMRQAVPAHLKPVEQDLGEEKIGRNKQFMLNAEATGHGSSDMVKKTLAMSSSFTNNEGCENGVLQYDADTLFPYTVMDSTIDSAGGRGAKTENTSAPVFNLVVVHDIFDTCERMKIFLRPLAQRYPGLQILLWNYPGQAFTEHREEQLLNNEYVRRAPERRCPYFSLSLSPLLRSSLLDLSPLPHLTPPHPTQVPRAVPRRPAAARRPPGHQPVRHAEALLPAGLRQRRQHRVLLLGLLPQQVPAVPRAHELLLLRRPPHGVRAA